MNTILYKTLVRAAGRIVGRSGMDPRDLVHEAWIRVGSTATIGAFVITMRRLAMDRWRAAKVARAWAATQDVSAHDPGHAGVESARELFERIQGLTPARAAVIRAAIEGGSTAEIAEALGWAYGTVCSQIARAREDLRREDV